MNLIRVTILAITGALAANHALAAPQPLRLFEIFALRVVENEGALVFERGLFNAKGEFKGFELGAIPPGATVPPEALNANLVPIAIWYGYEVLGAETLANFRFGSPLIQIGEQGYFSVVVADTPRLDSGELLNISARGEIHPGGEPLIGGFVVGTRMRRVLIRGIGPTLSELGVVTPLPDPVITIHRHGETGGIASSDDWGQQGNADEIEATALLVGAFPLPRDSKDAAHVLELEPGLYTAHLTGAGNAGGTALLEIYAVP